VKRYCLEVTGDFACFTSLEMKVERVSYQLITPSTTRAIFELILRKPAIRRRIRIIEVLRPIRLRRNEVGGVASTRNVETAMRTKPYPAALLRALVPRCRAGRQFTNPRAALILCGHRAASRTLGNLFRRRVRQPLRLRRPFTGQHTLTPKGRGLFLEILEALVNQPIQVLLIQTRLPADREMRRRQLHAFFARYQADAGLLRYDRAELYEHRGCHGHQCHRVQTRR
jgi:CRISPR-associated Cas5-like protein